MVDGYFEEPAREPITQAPLPSLDEIEAGIGHIVENARTEELETELAIYCVRTLHEYILLKDGALRGQKLEQCQQLSGYLALLQERLSSSSGSPGG